MDILKTGISYAEAREERKLLKQKLFTIRRVVEGHPLKLSKELLELKMHYESHPMFTSWSDFPEKWEIGDPNYVKEHSPIFNDVDKANLQRVLGKPYSEVIRLTLQKDDETWP